MKEELTLHTDRFLIACDNFYSIKHNLSLLLYGFIHEQGNKLYDNFPMDIIQYLSIFSYKFEKKGKDNDQWQDCLYRYVELENFGTKAIINDFQEGLIGNMRNSKFILQGSKKLEREQMRRVWNVKVSTKVTESMTFNIGIGGFGLTDYHGNQSEFCIKSGSTLNKQIKVNNDDIINILFLRTSYNYGILKFGVNYDTECVEIIDEIMIKFWGAGSVLKVTLFHDMQLELL